MDHEQTYRIRCRGELGAEWSAWFAGMTVQAEPEDVTLLVGRLADQAALHGVLAAIRDLGLELVSVESIAPAAPQAQATSTSASPTSPGEGGE